MVVDDQVAGHPIQCHDDTFLAGFVFHSEGKGGTNPKGRAVAVSTFSERFGLTAFNRGLRYNRKFYRQILYIAHVYSCSLPIIRFNTFLSNEI